MTEEPDPAAGVGNGENDAPDENNVVDDPNGNENGQPQPNDSNGQPKADDPPAAKPKAKVPDSPTKKYDAKPLKQHEAWLKKFGPHYENSKIGENLVKKYAPKAFPYVKAVSDVKSSKNCQLPNGS